MVNALEIICIAGSAVVCMVGCLIIRPPLRKRRSHPLDVETPRKTAQTEWNEKYTTEGARKKKTLWGAPLPSTASVELRHVLADQVFGAPDEYMYRRKGDRTNWGYGVRSSESDAPRYRRGVRGHVNSLASVVDVASDGYVSGWSEWSRWNPPSSEG
jgi:hypothetical protein